MKVAELEEENMDENKDGKIFDYFSGIYTMKANSMSIGDIYVPLMTLNIMKHTISGQIWMDKNANSRKDDTAAGISNISVSLLQKDPNTGEYKPAEDELGMPIKDTTDSEGNYELSRWMHGDYRVQFEIPKGTQYLSTLDAYGDGYSGSSSMFRYMSDRKNGDLTVYADCVFKNNDPQMDGMNAGLIDERGVEAPEEITIYKGYDSDLTYTLTPAYLKELSDEGGLTITPGAGSDTYFTWDSATKKLTGVAEGEGTLTLAVPQPEEVSDYTGETEAKAEITVKVVDITPDAVVTIPATVVLTDGNVGDTGVDKDAYAGADVTVRMVEGYDSRTVKVQLEDGLTVTEQGGKESLSVRYYVGKDWKNENTGSKGLIDIATIGKDHDAEADVHFITARGQGKKTYEGTANWQLSFAEGGSRTAAASRR